MATKQELIEEFGEDTIKKYVSEFHDEKLENWNKHYVQQIYFEPFQNNEAFARSMVEEQVNENWIMNYIDWEGLTKDLMTEYIEINNHYFLK